MKLSELVHEVWSDDRVRELRIRKGEVALILEVLAEKIITALMIGEKVKYTKLFSLSTKKVKSRKIMNPITKEHMKTDEYYKLSVEPSKKLKEGLKNIREFDE